MDELQEPCAESCCAGETFAKKELTLFERLDREHQRLLVRQANIERQLKDNELARQLLAGNPSLGDDYATLEKGL